VSVNIEVEKADRDPLKVYVRVEQAGRIKVGKLELAEDVLELNWQLPNSKDPTDQSRANLEFFLTGPLSPISNFLFDRAINLGDDLLVVIAVSSDGKIWSDERVIEFKIEDGLLLPIEH